ncbi:hypothetical protein N9V27_00720 [bacterium]|nr:hypothetical protein [bacterium]
MIVFAFDKEFPGHDGDTRMVPFSSDLYSGSIMHHPDVFQKTFLWAFLKLLDGTVEYKVSDSYAHDDTPIALFVVSAQGLPFHDKLNVISDYLRNSSIVRHKNFKIWIDFSTEGWITAGTKFHNWVIANDLQGRVLYTSGQFDWKHIYKKFVPEKQHVIDFIPTCMWNRLHPPNEVKHLSGVELLKSFPSYRPTQNRIMCFNRYVRDHRVQLALELENLNILDKITFSLRAELGDGYDDLGNQYKDYISEDVFDRLKAKLPLVVDTDEFDYNWIYVEQEKTYDTFKSHPINLVTETMYRNDGRFLSEKSFKPMALRQIFLIAGNKGTLELLRHYGFKTFAQCGIDESYDTVSDPVKRMKALTLEIQRLVDMPEHKFQDILSKAEEIIEHNHILIWDDEHVLKNSWGELVNYLDLFNNKG